MMLRSARFLLSICLGALAVASQSLAAQQSPTNPGAARVWFMWPSETITGYDTGAAPTIYVNGTPIGAIRGGTEFYRDFAPGKYQFAVEPFGLPTGQTETVQLAPGAQIVLQVQWTPTWEEGYPNGRKLLSHSFFIRPMPPQLAGAYLASLVNLGPR